MIDLKDLREKMQSPGLFSNVEKVITQSETSRERLKMIEARVAARRKMMMEAAAS